jgi:hypothetical protein
LKYYTPIEQDQPSHTQWIGRFREFWNTLTGLILSALLPALSLLCTGGLTP